MIFKNSRPRHSIPATYHRYIPIPIYRDRCRDGDRYRDLKLWVAVASADLNADERRIRDGYQVLAVYSTVVEVPNLRQSV
ncbi:hypothetical protein RHMOL_Rhmol02G0108100 [Rhododendron molle]|uniref:Uncharacterized protein n=1 Tax=Rhododendron molle TaxID=49168 RepID=A0ACC0PNH8_RHOML|nr:hypothetical protein RHMOL_Rhmol02G0108100 [Rhododendron molle]